MTLTTIEKRCDAVPSMRRDKPPHRQNVLLPLDQTNARKNGKHTNTLRSVDDLWFGEEPLYLGMKVFTEEELAQHAKVPVAQVTTWISQHGLPRLPTSDGSVRIAEAAFDEWAKHLPRQQSLPITEQTRHAVATECLPVLTGEAAGSVDVPSCKPDVQATTTPTWLDKDMTLKWGDCCLKTFSKSAKVITRLLQEFDKARWRTPIAIPSGITKRQAQWALTHMKLDDESIIAFEYSANKHTKKTPMHWYKLQNS